MAGLASGRDDAIERIRGAFRGVALEDGIGLLEGNAIDEYADGPTRAGCREKDERLNWEAIPAESLNQNYWCLSYLDPKGMRFLLPAFLVADLRGDMGMDPVFCLTQTGDYATFSLFSPDQRGAVQSYLLYVREHPDYKWDRPHIDLSLEAFWKA